MTCARLRWNATPSEHFLHTSHCTLHTPTSHFTFALHLISNHVSSSQLIPSLPTCCLSKFFSTGFISSGHWSTFLISKFFSTHLSCSARRKALNVREKSLAQKNFTKYFVHLCTTKLAQSTSQYYFVLQCMRKALLRTTKRAQSTSPYFFVLQSLHKALPSTTLYYKACKDYVPVILYCKACTKHFPVLLCTTKLAPVPFLKKLLSASPPAIERWPQGSLMCFLGGSPRESRREKKENKKNKKGRRRQKPQGLL